MARNAKHVFTEPADIARIEQLVCELPSQASVRITQHNGDIYTGTVTERPAAQLYEDASGNEGINAQVRLDDPQVPTWNVYLWLSDVARIERLDPR